MGLLDDKHSTKQQPDDNLWEGLFNEEELDAPPEPAAAPDDTKERAEEQPSKHERPVAKAKKPKRERPVAKVKKPKRERPVAKAKKPKRERSVAKTQKPKRERAKGKGLTPGQILILLLLGISIILAYFVLVSVIRGTLSANRSQNGTVIPAETPGAAPIAPATFTPIPPTPTRSLAAIATPTQTPTPLPLAATQFDQQVSVNPDDIELRLQRGAEYLSLGAYVAALADFEHAQSLDDRRAEVYVGIGQARYQLLDWPAAESALLTAISFNEDLPEPYFGIGMIYYMQGRYGEATKEFDRAAEKNPDYAEAEAWLAIAAAQSGDAGEAMAAAGRAISLTQKSAIVHIARSWAYRVQSPPNIDAAQGDLLYAQKLAPYNLEVLIALAQFYTDYRPERIIEAEQLGHYAIQWAKNDLERARALHTLGHTYLAQERKDDAKKVLVEAADLTTYEGQVLLGGVVEDLERALAP